MTEPVPQLDAEALAIFARKGLQGGPDIPQAGNANAVKVRRVLQLTSDLARRPLGELRILDLGCGEGVYAIEAGLRGARVLAIDGRTQRMEEGAACAARHGLRRVAFEQRDVRSVTPATHGRFDVVWALGILYHLDAPEVFGVLENLRELCTGLCVIDTLVSVRPDIELEWRGRRYAGERCREHAETDAAELRHRRVLKSLDNACSVRFTAEALVRALHEAGFSSVLQCQAPPEPGKAADRITLAALAGERVAVATYPWVNGLDEDEIARRLRDLSR